MQVSSLESREDACRAYDLMARALECDKLWKDLFEDSLAGEEERARWGVDFWLKMRDGLECYTKKVYRIMDPSDIVGVGVAILVPPKRTNTYLKGLGERLYGEKKYALWQPLRDHLIASYHNFKADFVDNTDSHLHLVMLVMDSGYRKTAMSMIFEKITEQADLLGVNIYVYCPLSDVDLYKEWSCEELQTKEYIGGGERAFMVRYPSFGRRIPSSPPVPTISQLD